MELPQELPYKYALVIAWRQDLPTRSRFLELSQQLKADSRQHLAMLHCVINSIDPGPHP